MEFLAKLFGKTDDGQPEAMTYEQLKAKIEADKKIKLVNLEDGGYVSKEKFDAADTELKGYKKQLEDANKEIESYKGMDIEGIKNAAAEYEKNSKVEIEKLQKQLKDQKIEFAEDKFLSGYKFVDDFAKAGVRAELRSKQFKFDESTGTFLGADDYMKSLMESHKAAFVVEESGDDGAGGNGAGGENSGDAGAGTKQKPSFLGKPGAQGAGAGGEANPFGFNFMGVRPAPKSN